MLEALSQALLLVFGNPGFIVSMAGGVLAGLVVGILPGFGTMLAMSLFLPFAFKLSPVTALPFLAALLAASRSAGSVTSVLLGIPGESVNAATIVDGFPMTKKGEGRRAVVAAILSSGLGGLVTVVLSLAIVPLVVPLVMTIRAADMVFLILVGIAFIGVLGKGTMIKGVVSGGIGLLLGFIGFEPMTGTSRFTFDSVYLYSGLDLVALAMGVFAIPEVVALFVSGGTIARAGATPTAPGGALQGLRDIFRHWWLFLRSSAVGFFIGVLPGIGAQAATWVAYGQAKAMSKRPDDFGKGTVEGVIAPESANNACLTGDLLVTLSLGIPGSASMVLIIAAFYMVGLVPGPDMMTKHLVLSLSLILTTAVANVLGVAICFFGASQLARIALVPARILMPLITVLIFVGAYTANQRFNDIVVVLIFGAVGLLMIRYGFSRPALLLGFIMAPLFETNVFVALQVGGPLFFMRPFALVAILAIIALFAWDPLKELFLRNRRREASANGGTKE